MEKIDFVLPWVDDTDPAWNRRRIEAWNRFHGKEEDGQNDNGDCRYREMGLLKYWFRSVEKFAPWVNKVFFVTCGQKPDWLNAAHPKLVLVNHNEYIPREYLPTFSSIPIELNLHRISELSEHFVLFNDDVFLIRPVSPEFYFHDGLPVLPADLTPCDYFGFNNWSFTCFNVYCVLNDHFNLYDAIWKNRDKWFCIKELGIKQALKNLACLKLNRTMGFRGFEHLSIAHLKSTFRQVWETCPDLMDSNSRQAFRTNDQINHWLFDIWNQAKGAFFPGRPYSHGSHFNISSGQLDEICSLIRSQALPQLCLNDSAQNDNPEKCFAEIRQALGAILPEKSAFEL